MEGWKLGVIMRMRISGCAIVAEERGCCQERTGKTAGMGMPGLQQRSAAIRWLGLRPPWRSPQAT
jgi:hypothetical protein